MRKIIVFTDTHFVPEGGTIIGLDPAERFAQGLAHALERHPDAARIVICGDLAHHGAEPEYRRLQAALSGCPLPVSPMLGNHDRRGPFRAVFADAPTTDRGFVQAAIDIGDTRLILLDTLDEAAADRHSGVLCAHRLDWLDAALAGAQGRRVIVFCHHPPIATGFAGMDAIGLRNRDALLARLGPAHDVAQIVSGHIHRTIQGRAAGIPVAIFKSTCHQMPMLFAAEDTGLSVDEPGAYGILIATGDGIVVHTEDFTLPPSAALSDRQSAAPRP